jgi:hypothetical protein
MKSHAPQFECAEPVCVHLVKSILMWHFGQECSLSNSSEKISMSFPQLGHLHSKDDRFFNCSHPGQDFGVLILCLLTKDTVFSPQFFPPRSCFFIIHHSAFIIPFLLSLPAPCSLLFAASISVSIAVSFAASGCRLARLNFSP